MRAQRAGLVVTISSTAGIASTGDFLTAYAASKFGVEGFMEGLTTEVAPFGIKAMLVEPGFFRTEPLTPQSTSYAKPSIDDYAERTRATVQAWQGMDGKQGGDPAKLAEALVKLVALDEPPCASPPAPMPSGSSRSRHRACSSSPTPTGSSPAASATTTPERGRRSETSGTTAPLFTNTFRSPPG